MRNNCFEWDDAKAASNYSKHRVHFETASEAFDDPNFHEEIDDDPDEERWRLIGATSSGLLLVVYTERGDRNRIISARPASPRECDLYRRQARLDR
jgi:uncharacterized protein